MDELNFYEDGMVIDADFEGFDEDFDDEGFEESDDFDGDDAMEAYYDTANDYYDEDADEMAELFGISRKKRNSKQRVANRRLNRQKKQIQNNVMTAKRIRANQSAIAIAKRNIRRNAVGIKQVNSRVASVNSRVSATARINRIQSGQIRKMAQLQKAMGIMEFVQAYDAETKQINTFQLLKGAVASGLIGSGKGAIDNPYLLGAAGFFLNTRNGSLGDLLGGPKA